VLQQEIEDELWWSPFVDANEVKVEVENGVATLTGAVDTWSERNAAAENALEAGAIQVRNRLDVDYGPAS
jgi:osmotically-inducible protein OsmY